MLDRQLENFYRRSLELPRPIRGSRIENFDTEIFVQHDRRHSKNVNPCPVYYLEISRISANLISLVAHGDVFCVSPQNFLGA